MIVLDTHAWVWWISDPASLPAQARRAIGESLDATRPVHVYTISTWEVALLVARGRLELKMDVRDWVARAEEAPEIVFVPIGNRIALRAVHLEDFAHRDPADRLIVATALDLGARLVTSDERLRGYAPLYAIWD